MGAIHVTGMDFSSEMLEGAKDNNENCKIKYIQGNALDTKLDNNQFDLVLQRALIHHVTNLNLCFSEACRILKQGGTLIIQDRTIEDCLLPGSKTHIRGYFFEKYPKLIEKELVQRHKIGIVRKSLADSGLLLKNETKLWEVRRRYNNFEELANDLMLRTGRSTLFELNDAEIFNLVKFIEDKFSEQPESEIFEEDCWTIWFATKL